MKTLGQARSVIVVLSEKYLRSPYCMTELYSVYQNARQERQEFLNRIIPLVLKDANIGTWRDRAAYAKHWEAEFKAMEQDIPHLGEEDLKLYKAMRRWHNEVGDMLAERRRLDRLIVAATTGRARLPMQGNLRLNQCRLLPLALEVFRYRWYNYVSIRQDDCEKQVFDPAVSGISDGNEPMRDGLLAKCNAFDGAIVRPLMKAQHPPHGAVYYFLTA